MTDLVGLLDWLTINQSVDYMARAGIQTDAQSLARVYAKNGEQFILNNENPAIFVPSVDDEKDTRWPGTIPLEGFGDGHVGVSVMSSGLWWIGDLLLERPLNIDGWMNGAACFRAVPLFGKGKSILAPVYCGSEGVGTPMLVMATWLYIINNNGVKLSRLAVDNIISRVSGGDRPGLYSSDKNGAGPHLTSKSTRRLGETHDQVDQPAMPVDSLKCSGGASSEAMISPPELPWYMQSTPPGAVPKGTIQVHGLHDAIPVWLESLADDDVVVFRRGSYEELSWVANVRSMLRDAIDRQREGRFFFDEFVDILAESSGEDRHRLWKAMMKAFNDGNLCFYTESGTPITPEESDMPLVYGEVTTSKDIDNCLEKIGALYRWPKIETTSAASKQLISQAGYGAYTTPALELLSRHVDKFWVNYDPEEPDTAPDKDATLAWVRAEAKKSGLSQNIADAIDLLTRHQNAKAGNRVKRVTARKNTGARQP